MAYRVTERVRQMRDDLGEPVDGASLAVFRVLFGILVAVGIVRFFAYGWIAEQYIEPQFYFGYEGLEWIRPWPGEWMVWHFAITGVLAVAVAVGVRYRISVTLLFLAFTYIELLDKTNYLNHYYLVSLLLGLMMLMPLGRQWSIDAWRRPRLALDAMPRWCLTALRLQVGIVYFFAGVAKLRGDWLLDAQPLTIWFAARTDAPVIGPLLQLPHSAFVASWFGAIFDLSFPFLMMVGRVRRYVFIIGVMFHIATGILFQLGMFPWIMVAAATVFFPPDWPRRVLRRLAPRAKLSRTGGRPSRNRTLALGAVLAVFFSVQVLMPLRKHLTPGDAAWSEAGFRFAWHVMLAEKAGVVWFYVRERETGRTWEVRPREILTKRQVKMMSTSPDMIVQFAKYLARDFASRGIGPVEVRAEAQVSLNGRPSRLLIDPNVDLTSVDDPRTVVLPGPREEARRVAVLK